LFYKEVAQKLIDAGYETYLVGGALRDELLGREPNDYDLMIKGKMQDLIHLATKTDLRILPTGIDYGIVRAVHEDTKEYVDISIPRLEYDYDGRRPTLVEAAPTIKEDLARRDFTMNAMARDLKTNHLIDLFGGIQDLNEGYIRCVGNPAHRFKEDGLRIVRAIRFAALLGFKIDNATSKAMLHPDAQHSLKTRVSNERFRDEFCKILEGAEDVGLLLAMNKFVDTFVFKLFIPELLDLHGVKQNIHHSYDVWEHTIAALVKTPKDLIIRLAVLFHDIGKPATQAFKNEEYGYTFYQHHIIGAKMTEEILNRLSFAGYENLTPLDVKRIKRLIRNHLSFQNMKVHKLLHNLDIERFGIEIIEQLRQVMLADLQGRADVPKERLQMVEEKIKPLYDALNNTNTPNRLHLKINGNDLKNMGLKPGPEFKVIIHKLWEMVVDGKIKNDRKSLLTQVYLWQIENS